MTKGSIRIAPLAPLLLLAVLVPVRTRAWSGPSHEAVCEIAFLELSPTNQTKIETILSEDTAQFRTFAAACAWPDLDKHTPGTVQNKRRPEHFIDVPRDLQAMTTEKCPTAPECLFTAIAADSKKLKTTTGQEQREALKFLGHWIGDLHQPLHISFEDDAGGNGLVVTGITQCNELHAVWDFCIPDDLRHQMSATDGADFGKKLQAEITDTNRTDWRKGSLADWANESLAIARTPDVAYCALDAQNECCYPNSMTGCAHSGTKKSTLALSTQYDDDHVKAVREQLEKAGVRLAKVLNEALQ